MGGDVGSLQDKLTGGKGLYGAGIVHTDLKQDNILFDTELTQDDIEALAEADPSQYHPLAEPSWDCTVQAAVSQHSIFNHYHHSPSMRL